MKTCFLFMILSILTSCSMQKTKGVSLDSRNYLDAFFGKEQCSRRRKVRSSGS